MTEKAAGTKIWCPFYRGVRLIWVSVLRGSTVYLYYILRLFAALGGAGCVGWLAAACYQVSGCRDFKGT